MNDSSATVELEREISENSGGDCIRRTAFRTALLCCIALLLALAWPWPAGRVYVADDLGAMHLPMRVFYSRQLAAGEPFDWNPELFGGFYLTGEGQAGTYHPLHWFLYRFLPLTSAFDLECLLSYPFMLAGMYLFLRRWQLRRDAGLLGAMTFTFGGFNLLHFVHPNVVAIVAHLPWLLVAIDIMVRGINPRDRRWAFAAVALLTGSQLLLGSPQFVLFSLLVEAGYVSWLAGVRGTLRWILAIFIGGLIGGVQLLPTFDALAHSVRHSAGGELAIYGSLNPLNLVQLVAPYLLDTRVVGENTHELGLYIGAVPLTLALWWSLSGQARNRISTFAVVTALAALLWAFGAMGPLGWLESNVPLINRFRIPSRAIVIFQLAMSMLAALGFAALFRQSGHHRSTRLLWLLPVASVVASAIAWIVWPQHVAAWPLVSAGPILLTIAVGLLDRAAKGSHWAVVALLVFTAVDLVAYGASYSIVGKNASLMEYIGGLEQPPGPPNGRVAIDLMSGTEFANGEHGMRAGDHILLSNWKCIDGYLGLEPARRLDYRRSAALRVAGVTWLSKMAAANFAATSGEIAWHANPLPRAWLVTRSVASSNPAEDISRIELAAEALLDKPLPMELPAGTPGAASVLIDRPGRIELTVDCQTPQLLVVNESYHEGWRATIDGQPAGVVRANGDFLGLPLPAGQHQIGLEFRPKSLFFGRVTSGFGLGLIVAIVVWPRRRFAAD